ncbi:hypothetical protein PR048_025350 [Dryococelus australis]|uniref:Uncharacterized protein n=1 Tax=Dryococelus australis TaxID=614101 RepID=A0ABQ9GR41_9NEOP|nr:hypothetical protein PR048_025350 [Dryococelus australis]
MLRNRHPVKLFIPLTLPSAGKQCVSRRRRPQSSVMRSVAKGCPRVDNVVEGGEGGVTVVPGTRKGCARTPSPPSPPAASSRAPTPRRSSPVGFQRSPKAGAPGVDRSRRPAVAASSLGQRPASRRYRVSAGLFTPLLFLHEELRINVIYHENVALLMNCVCNQDVFHVSEAQKRGIVKGDPGTRITYPSASTCKALNRHRRVNEEIWAALNCEVLRADEGDRIEYGGGGNGRFPTRLANQRHRPARFPLVKIRGPGRGLSPVRLVSFDRRMNKVMRPMGMIMLHKAEEYTTCIQADLKQGSQKGSFYREQPINSVYFSAVSVAEVQGFTREDIHGDSSPFLLQPFHGFWPRLTSHHPAIQFVPKMFYRVEVGALGGPVQSANIVVGVPLHSSP